MKRLAHRRFARREDLGLARGDFAILARLHTPQRIQRFLERVAVNHEIGGETTLSVQQVLLQRRAHCIEAAFVAACALWVHGERPLVMFLDCDPCDCPHVVALFRSNDCWGAISKSRGEGLSYRDPVYRNLRELAMSWFHEYLDDRGPANAARVLGRFRHARHRASPVGHVDGAVRRSPGPPGEAPSISARLAAWRKRGHDTASMSSTRGIRGLP